jgi:hypothetical protein
MCSGIIRRRCFRRVVAGIHGIGCGPIPTVLPRGGDGQAVVRRDVSALFTVVLVGFPRTRRLRFGRRGVGLSAFGVRRREGRVGQRLLEGIRSELQDPALVPKALEASAGAHA